VTYQVNEESGVNSLTCAIGVGHDSCEYNGGSVLLQGTTITGNSDATSASSAAGGGLANAGQATVVPALAERFA